MTAGLAAARRESLDAYAIAVMIFLTLAWGVNSVAGKVAVEGFDPMLLSFLRAVLGGGAVMLWCRFKGIDLFAADGSLVSGSLVGLLFGVEFALIYFGLDLTSASRANLMTNTMPLFALIGSHFLLGERATAMKIAGTFLSFAGVAVVFFDKLSLPSPNAVYGDLMCIAGGLAWAATALAIRKTNIGKLPPEKTLLYQLAGAALVAAPFLPFSEDLIRKLGLATACGLAVSILLHRGFHLCHMVFADGPLSADRAFHLHLFIASIWRSFQCLDLGDPLTAGLTGGLALIVAGLIMVNGNFRRSAS